jgi:ATP-binding cassette subfamily C protein LapB
MMNRLHGNLPAGAEDGHDSLLCGLLWVCRRFGIDKTPTSFLAGLPSQSRLSLDQGIRALDQAGFDAQLVQREPATLMPQSLPVVLMMKDGSALLLLGIYTAKEPVSTQFEVLRSGPDGDASWVMSEPELMASYGGHCLLVKRRPKTAQQDNEEINRDTTGWLWRVVWKFRRYYYDAVIAAVLINVLSTLGGLFAMHVYDRVIPMKAYSTLWALAIGVVVALLFEAGARHLRDYLVDLAARKSDIALASTLFRQALGLRLEHTPPSSGAFAHQVRQFETVRDFGTSVSLAILTDFPFAILFIFMIFSTAGPLAMVPAVVIPLVILMALWVQFPLHKMMLQAFHDQAQMHGVLIESVEGLETLRVTGAAGIMVKRYEDLNAATAHSGMRYRRLSNLVMTFFTFAQQAQTIVMLVWGTYLVHAGEVTQGALVAAVMFAGRAISPVGAFVSMAIRYQSAKTAYNSLSSLMALPTERDLTRSYVQKTKFDGRIEVQKLSFAYPAVGTGKSPHALRDVSLVIEPGERVAFVGKIGSGKSTLLRMIAALYQPTEGQVKIDNLDIRQIDPADFRDQVGYVTQDLRLFRGTLRENIFLGRPNVTWDDFMQMVELTGLDKIADAHPLGYDMPIGSMGLGLSGGQRQLVALARALVTNPKILLMDEPTSAMDMQTELLFTKKLATIAKDRTVVIVTHRPSLLSVVDRVVVMDNQRLVADGPKERILAMLSGAESVHRDVLLNSGESQ